MKRFVPSRVYGAEHLLRFFLRLPRIAAYPSPSSTFPFQSIESVQELANHASELIVFLQRDRDFCFRVKYRTVANADEADAQGGR